MYALKAAYIEYDLVERDFFQGDHKSDEITAYNGFQTLPILITPEGTVLTESNAIIKWAFKDDEKWYPRKDL